MRVRVIDLTNVQEKDFQSKTAEVVKGLTDALNGNLNFSDNVQSSQISIEFTGSDVNTRQIHGLGRKPAGYLVMGAAAAMSIYDGSSENTEKEIYLRASATGTARILVF